MRTKNSVWNYLSFVIPYIVIGIIGLFKIKLFISILGVETQGVYQLFTQLFVYLALAESGFSTAVVYEYFKPLSSKNFKKIGQIFSGATKIFLYIGLAILIIGIILSFNLNLIIKTDFFEYSYLQVAFIIFLVSEIINYFFASYRILFIADQKNYKVNIVMQSFLIIRTSMEIALLLLGYDLIIIISSHIITSLLSNIIIVYLAKKEYKQINFKEPIKDYSATKHIKSIIPHKIGSLVSNNIDIVIISAFVNLTTVAIYAVYNYIMIFINRLVLKITPSITSGIGNLLIVNQEKRTKFFNELNSSMFLIAIIICIPLFFFLNPFIELWVGENMLVSRTTSLLFVIILFFHIVRIPINSFVNAAGLFKETRLATIVESIINLSITLLLVRKYGISGVLLATIIACIVDLNYRVFIIYKGFLKISIKYYYMQLLKHITIISLISLLNLYIYNVYENYIEQNFIAWFLCGTGIFIMNSILLIFLYKRFFPEINLVGRIKIAIMK